MKIGKHYRKLKEYDRRIERRKAIIQLTLDGKVIKKYESVFDASVELDTDSSCISKVLVGKRTHHRGFKFEYA